LIETSGFDSYTVGVFFRLIFQTLSSTFLAHFGDSVYI